MEENKSYFNCIELVEKSSVYWICTWVLLTIMTMKFTYHGEKNLISLLSDQIFHWYLTTAVPGSMVSTQALADWLIEWLVDWWMDGWNE